MKSLRIQTPIKETSRSSELTDRRSNESSSRSITETPMNSKKITKKTLNNAFVSVTEDGSLKSSKDSIAFSPAPELSDGSPHPDPSASFETFARSALDESTPSSMITSIIEEESKVMEISSLDVDVVVDLLRKARTELLDLRDADLSSKKLLEALVQHVITDFCGMPVEMEQFSGFNSVRVRIGLMSLLLFILSVMAILIGISHLGGTSVNYPPPT